MANQSRRTAVKSILTGSAVLAATGLVNQASAKTESLNMPLKNNIKHSVCQWCFGDMSVEDLCIAVKKIGFSAIDLVGPKDWPTLKKHGISVRCVMVLKLI